MSVKQRMTLKNDFHNTMRDILVSDGDVLSLRRVRDIKRSLCSHSDCVCGDILGRRGPQESSELDFLDVQVAELEYGELLVVAVEGR